MSGVLAALLLVGCADTTKGFTDDRHSPQGSKSSAAASASRTRGAEQTGALAAYRAMWHDMVSAGRTSDASSPLLDDHARDGALGLLRYMMSEDRKKGVVSKGRPHLAPVVKDSAATKVVIRDCADDSNWLLYNTSDGKLENDVPGGHHRIDATVSQLDGTWHVTRLYIDEVGTC